jgi:AcrR family transcriptional regulator
MGRQPKARAAVLEAARRIVIERGAGALTFEELATESGVTRGGICYHFANKEALLQALIEQDVLQWSNASEELAPPGLDEQTSALIAAIRLSTGRKSGDDHRRFVSGMLAAITLDPRLLEPCREYCAGLFPDGDWTEQDLRQVLLRLAADGLFWLEVFGLHEFPPAARARLVELMERLAVDWASDRADQY